MSCTRFNDDLEGILEILTPRRRTAYLAQETFGIEEWTPYHGKRGGEGWQWNGQGKPRYQKEKPRESGEGVAVDVPDTQAGVSSAGSVATAGDSQKTLFDKGAPADSPARPEPAGTMDALGSRYARVADLYQQDAGVSEGYSIGEHTAMVLDMWDRKVPPARVAELSERLGLDVPRVMKTTLLLHDIGKPLAIEEGEKWRQHEFTLPIMADVMQKEGFSELEIALAQAVVGHDIFGDVLKGRISPQAGADRLLLKAETAGVPPDAFAELAALYFTADAASYPYLYERVFREGPGGELEFKSPDYQILMDEVRSRAKPALPTGSAAIKEHVAAWTPERKQADWKEHGTRGGSFKAFFGDWEHEPETASKVVDPETGEPTETAEISGAGSRVTDDDGAPRAVYHGTTRGGFKAFDPSKMSPDDQLLYGPGFYFTEDLGIAEEYSGKQNFQISDRLATREEAEQMLAAKGEEWTARYSRDMHDFKLGVTPEGDGWRVTGEGWYNKREQDLSRPLTIDDLEWIREYAGRLAKAHADAGFPDSETRANIISLTAGRVLQEAREGKNWQESENGQWIKGVLLGGGRDGDEIRSKMGLEIVEREVPAEVKAVYLNIRRPFDADNDILTLEDIRRARQVYGPGGSKEDAWVDTKLAAVEESIQLHKERLGETLQYQWHSLEAGFNTSRLANEILAAAGYDGLTHIGGKIMGKREHRVWIAFQPEQIKAKDNAGTFDTASANMYESWLRRYGTRIALEAWDETKYKRDKGGKFAEKDEAPDVKPFSMQDDGLGSIFGPPPSTRQYTPRPKVLLREVRPLLAQFEQRLDRIEPDDRPRYRRTLETALAHLTPVTAGRLAENVRGFEVFESTRRLTEALQAQLATEGESLPEDMLISGCYNVQTKQFFLDGGPEKSSPEYGDSMAHVYAHELTHAIDADDRVGMSPEWESAWKAELADGQLTDYAKQDSIEGLAEFGRLVLLGDHEAARKFPACYEIWEAKGWV